MDEPGSVFTEAQNSSATRQPVKLPTFTPFVIIAGLLVAIWAVLAFVLPPPHHDIPASALLPRPSPP
ncbi:hypothetical protein [Acetobacter oeni]|uniref:hypothetical protein n=1 Tax=Acetobacter oeni TaxID=304077 RepID=UPI0011BE9BF7|nr:hypothetical protein [Acetobacter oeni]MBB3883588.1 hypothetical protein [Acetobacter oeni]NHO19675.1 hypothetical protein [Acetobacter oeni]GBR02787.1 hypothetical protein AA21952_0864 [Acetobacter oeni LMG 21952]